MHGGDQLHPQRGSRLQAVAHADLRAGSPCLHTITSLTPELEGASKPMAVDLCFEGTSKPVSLHFIVTLGLGMSPMDLMLS